VGWCGGPSRPVGDAAPAQFRAAMRAERPRRGRRQGEEGQPAWRRFGRRREDRGPGGAAFAPSSSALNARARRPPVVRSPTRGVGFDAGHHGFAGMGAARLVRRARASARGQAAHACGRASSWPPFDLGPPDGRDATAPGARARERGAREFRARRCRLRVAEGAIDQLLEAVRLSRGGRLPAGAVSSSSADGREGRAQIEAAGAPGDPRPGGWTFLGPARGMWPALLAALRRVRAAVRARRVMVADDARGDGGGRRSSWSRRAR